MKRRKFLASTGAAAGAAVLGNMALKNKVIAATEETNIKKSTARRTGKIKIGLYGITYLGVWFDGPGLTFEEFVGKGKEYGYDGIELDNKRPQGNPMDISEKRRDEMRNIMEKAGIEMPCIAANNDFSSPVPEQRECQLLMVKETARLARDLGAKIVRLFAAWPGVVIRNGVGTYDLTRGSVYSFEAQYPFATRLERWEYARECLKEAAGFGEEFGVIMALQNHAPLLRDWRDCYQMVKEVDSPWLKICLDAPMMVRKDPEWVENAVRTVGSLQIHSHFGGEFFRDESGNVQLMVMKDKYFKETIDWADYDRYIQLMNEIGFSGYFSYELCHHVRLQDGTTAKIDYIHEQAKMAREFMNNILANNNM